MHIVHRSWLLAVTIGLAAPCLAGDRVGSLQSTAATATAPVELRVENAPTLLGADVAQPRLSWLAPAGVTREQTHYQIQVALSEAALERGELIWDSGMIASSQHYNVAYAGPAPKARTRYVWRVRARYGVSLPGGWSRLGAWEMGLLQPADWHARWISADQRVEHIWSDSTTEWQFTATSGSIDFLFRASPVGKTFGEAYAWRLDLSETTPRLTAISRSYDGSAQAVVRERIIKVICPPLHG